jgi:hypothetical protein
MPHFERYQVLEAFKALFGIEDELGDGKDVHCCKKNPPSLSLQKTQGQG